MNAENNMSPSQLFRQKMMELVQEVMDEAGIYKCCVNCDHFHEATEVCKLATPPSRPPARVITFGCPAFDDTPVVYQLAPAQNKPVQSAPAPRNSKSLDDMDDDIPF